MPPLSESLQALRQHAPFDLVSSAALASIAPAFKEKQLKDGDVALSRTSRIRDLLIVLEGQIDIHTNQGVAASLVTNEAFPLEVLQTKLAGKPAGCDFVAAGPTHLLVIPGDALAELRSISKEFDDFCVSREVNYQQRTQAGTEIEVVHSGLQNKLDQLLPKGRRESLATDATIQDAIQQLHKLRATAVAITDQSRPVGIFSHHDLVSRVLIPKINLATPIIQVAPSPVVLSTEHLGFDAVVEMTRCGVQHIVVVDKKERYVGVLSDSDLLNVQQHSSNLHLVISSADSPADFIVAAKKIREVASSLIMEGVNSSHLTQLVSKLNDRLVERIVEIEAARANLAMHSFCWIALGSEGRHEQTMHTDQDNGLVFVCDDDEQLESMRSQMTKFALRVNKVLDRCGFTLCSGNIMASNPECCLTQDEWRERFANWIEAPTPEALLNASIFFDLRPLCGNKDLCADLIEWLAQEAKHHKRFLHLMTDNALRRAPPIGLLRNFVVDKSDGCLDIKLSGLTLLVDAARIFALASGCSISNTLERFRAASENGLGSSGDVDNWVASFEVIQSIRIHHHNIQLTNDRPCSNRINPYALNNIDRRSLLESLRHASKAQKALTTQFSLDGRV